MTNKAAADTPKQTTVFLSLSPQAVLLLAELAEKGSVTGAFAGTLAELYNAAKVARVEAEMILKR